VRSFRTGAYCGAWIPREADRLTTRTRIEATLREVLCDPDGRLEVNASGPHWIGTRAIGLTYAHDENTVFLVWTPDGRPVGVDLEPADRQLKHSITALAERFFHSSEAATLARLSEPERTEAFLDLWLRKEAVAKLTRRGLVYSLAINLDQLEEIEFEEPALLPRGKRAVLAFFKSSTR
jgi:hypothetical protein